MVLFIFSFCYRVGKRVFSKGSGSGCGCESWGVFYFILEVGEIWKVEVSVGSGFG